MKKLNRRQFIRNSGLISIAGLGGLQIGIGQPLIKGKGGSNSGKDLLIFIFLDGAMDGLNMVPPRSGANYTEYATILRPNLHIPNNLSLTLNGINDFGFHPNATGFQSLYNQGKMAVVQATGMFEANRSHFEATAIIEQGKESASLNYGTGWLTRYFNSSLSTSPDALIPSYVPTYNTTDAVLGDPTALVMGSPTEFALNYGNWAWEDAMQVTVTSLFNNPNNTEELVAHQTLNASEIINNISWSTYVPDNNVVYPSTQLADKLKTVAQLYKSNVDLEVAYVPTGGWDTHIGQGTGTTGVFADLVSELSDAIKAFYDDMAANYAGKFTIVVQSEFGRRSYENDSNGTDHGYGNPMFILGDNVNSGFYGTFPGLQINQLFEQQDVAVTTDYRHVVAEVLIKRMQNRFLGYIFPQYTNYSPLGIVNGAQLDPVYDFNYDALFSNGFD